MSVGNAVGAVVGAVVGFFVGGPAGALKGAQLGMTIGGMIDPPKGPTVNGPRLTDLTMQTSSLNTVIPRIYGNIPICGNVFWLENNKLKEVCKKTKSGGKGGGGSATVKTYSYYATFAVGLCQGPITSIGRIWVGGVLAYDPSSTNQSTIKASNNFAKYFTLHKGTDTQLPDTRMQATLGVANVPAYRGLAYIVFKDLPLADYQNSLARAEVKVEIVKSGTPSEDVVSALQYTINNPEGNINNETAWNEGCGLFMTVNQVGTGDSYQISPTGLTGSWTLLKNPYTAQGNAFGRVSSNGIRFFWFMGYGSYVYTSKNGRTWSRATIGVLGTYTAFCDALNSNYVVIFPNEYHANSRFSINGGKTWIIAASFSQYMDYGSFSRQGGAGANGIFVFTKFTSEYNTSGGYDVLRFDLKHNTWSKETTPARGCAFVYWIKHLSVFFMYSQYQGLSGSKYQAAYSSDGKDWTYIEAPVNGELIVADDRVYMTTNSAWLWMSKDLVTWTKLIIPTAMLGQGGAWNGAVALTQSANRLGYTIRPRGLTTSTVTLSSIVSAECLASGILSASDIDVTTLTANVRGYRLGRVGALRAALEPLQATWPFDIIQSGYKLKFKPRGGTSVATIPAEDLAAREGE